MSPRRRPPGHTFLRRRAARSERTKTRIVMSDRLRPAHRPELLRRGGDAAADERREGCQRRTRQTPRGRVDAIRRGDHPRGRRPLRHRRRRRRERTRGRRRTLGRTYGTFERLFKSVGIGLDGRGRRRRRRERWSFEPDTPPIESPIRRSRARIGHLRECRAAPRVRTARRGGGFFRARSRGTSSRPRRDGGEVTTRLRRISARGRSTTLDRIRAVRRRSKPARRDRDWGGDPRVRDEFADVAIAIEVAVALALGGRRHADDAFGFPLATHGRGGYERGRGRRRAALFASGTGGGSARRSPAARVGLLAHAVEHRRARHRVDERSRRHAGTRVEAFASRGEGALGRRRGGQVGVSRQHESRDSNAAQRHHRGERTSVGDSGDDPGPGGAQRHGGSRVEDAVVHRQRRARLFENRGGEGDAGGSTVRVGVVRGPVARDAEHKGEREATRAQLHRGRFRAVETRRGRDATAAGGDQPHLQCRQIHGQGKRSAQSARARAGRRSARGAPRRRRRRVRARNDQTSAGRKLRGSVGG